MDISGILNNIYSDRFLFVAFVKYISLQICSHVFGIVLLDTFWRSQKLLFFEEEYFWNHLIFIFYPKTSNFHNSGMVSRRKLPNLALNNIFSFPIGLQYTLSFKWPDSDPKCRITIISKGQSLTLISLGEGGPGGGGWRGETAPW